MSSRTSYLFERYYQQNITPEERREFMQWLQSADTETLQLLMDKEWQRMLTDKELNTGDADRIFDALIRRDENVVAGKEYKVVYWWRYIAAALLILAIGSGIYYLSNQSYKSNKSSQITRQTKDTGSDILPGTNRATLTINNSQSIDLASDKTGININTTITYNDGQKIADAGQMLQLTTPRGGQYQAVLPDGTKVWLNAASSIKFPSKFNDRERRVEVTGEAYFEIEKDATKPFKVLGGGQEIEVLGTSFNVNVYDDEPVKKTTLLTGKIRISVGAPLVGAQGLTVNAGRVPTRGTPTILQPNQQAQIINSSLLITNSFSDVIAWKNGAFNFDNVTLDEAIRQIQRWYNIDIVYEGEGFNMPVPFSGKISRKQSLGSLLKLLNETDLVFKIENDKKLIIKK